MMYHVLKRSILILITVLSVHIYAQTKPNLLAIGQGVSSPTMTSTINYSSGFTRENPIGVVYQQNMRLSAHYDTGDDGNGNTNDGLGAEFGIGNGSFGLAIGSYKNNCDTCQERTAGAVGGVFSNFGIGFRFEENMSTFGLLFGVNDMHRIGIVVEQSILDLDDSDINTYAIGYSYVDAGFTFSLDVSKREYENQAQNSDVILVSPGVGLRSGIFALSLTYDMRLNEKEDNTNTNSENNDELWLGVGVGDDQSWHLAIYNQYIHEWTVAFSLFF